MWADLWANPPITNIVDTNSAKPSSLYQHHNLAKAAIHPSSNTDYNPEGVELDLLGAHLLPLDHVRFALTREEVYSMSKALLEPKAFGRFLQQKALANLPTVHEPRFITHTMTPSMVPLIATYHGAEMVTYYEFYRSDKMPVTNTIDVCIFGGPKHGSIQTVPASKKNISMVRSNHSLSYLAPTGVVPSSVTYDIEVYDLVPFYLGGCYYYFAAAGGEEELSKNEAWELVRFIKESGLKGIPI